MMTVMIERVERSCEALRYLAVLLGARFKVSLSPLTKAPHHQAKFKLFTSKNSLRTTLFFKNSLCFAKKRTTKAVVMFFA
jgi:hypothetical protein